MTQGGPIEPGLYDPADFVPRRKASPAAPGDALLPAEDGFVAAPRPSRWRRRFLQLLLACIVAYGCVQFAGAVAAAAAISPVLGWMWAALGIATIGAGTLWARGEVAELRRIARVEALQEEAARLLAGGGAGAAEPWFGEVARQLAATPGAGPGLARFQAMATDGYAAPDALALFEREAMPELDRAALAAVSRAARDCAIGTAASPLAALDAAIVALRSLRMIREVAGCYGFRPGGLVALALMRRVLANAAGVAGADILGELTAEAIGGLGHKLAGTVSARLGVGAFAGMRVARLGIATMHACRPLPFLAQRPLVSRVVGHALGWREGEDRA
ncbi:MAG: TIGR01620 family protein [Alphaproteobacteria bacterium]